MAETMPSMYPVYSALVCAYVVVCELVSVRDYVFCLCVSARAEARLCAYVCVCVCVRV